MTDKQTNDEKILQLKEVVSKKREELAELKSRKGGFHTNLVLEFDGEKRNFNVLNKTQFQWLLVKLSMYNKEAKSLGVDLTIGNWSIPQWMEDIQTKLRGLEIREKEEQLKQVESVLDQRLSEDTKNKIELDNISNLLNDFKL